MSVSNSSERNPNCTRVGEKRGRESFSVSGVSVGNGRRPKKTPDPFFCRSVCSLPWQTHCPIPATVEADRHRSAGEYALSKPAVVAGTRHCRQAVPAGGTGGSRSSWDRSCPATGRPDQPHALDARRAAQDAVDRRGIASSRPLQGVQTRRKVLAGRQRHSSGTAGGPRLASESIRSRACSVRSPSANRSRRGRYILARRSRLPNQFHRQLKSKRFFRRRECIQHGPEADRSESNSSRKRINRSNNAAAFCRDTSESSVIAVKNCSARSAVKRFGGPFGGGARGSSVSWCFSSVNRLRTRSVTSAASVAISPHNKESVLPRGGPMRRLGGRQTRIQYVTQPRRRSPASSIGTDGSQLLDEDRRVEHLDPARGG